MRKLAEMPSSICTSASLAILATRMVFLLISKHQISNAYNISRYIFQHIFQMSYKKRQTILQHTLIVLHNTHLLVMIITASGNYRLLSFRHRKLYFFFSIKLRNASNSPSILYFCLFYHFHCQRTPPYTGLLAENRCNSQISVRHPHTVSIAIMENTRQ